MRSFLNLSKSINYSATVGFICVFALSLFIFSPDVVAKKKKNEFFAPTPAADVTDKTVKKDFQIIDFHKGLKQHKRILIGNYRVAYPVAKSSYAKEQGGSKTESLGGGWEQVTSYKDQELRATAILKGVDSNDLNNITQKAYQDLIQRLKDAGREVVTMDQISDSEIIKNELKTNKVDENGEYWTNFGIGSARTMTLVTWPDNTPLWFMMGDTLDVGAGIKAAGNALKMKNFGFIKKISGEQNAALLDVSVTVRFADTWSLRAKSLRKAKVGVVPTMQMSVNKTGVTTGKKSPFGYVPGPGGEMKVTKKMKGFDLGNGWAEYKTNLDTKDSWDTVGQTIELEVITTPENMEKAVLEGLTSLNASIAAMAKKYPGKK